MTAIPSPEVIEEIKKKGSRKEQVEIVILNRGKLVSEESLMYDFSTKKEGEGMILPIVELIQIDYFLPK